MLQTERETGGELIERIHPSDEMYKSITQSGLGEELCISHYMTSGLSAWTDLKYALQQFGYPPSQLESVLDFASGYGRNTRFMIQDLSPDILTVSDVTPEMMAFQNELFGVRGVLSNEDPDRFECDEKFQIIFCVSLFSHLPRSTFDRWLDRLFRLLRPGGLLLITTRPMDHVQGAPDLSRATHEGENPADYAFEPCSETHRLGKQVYGTTWVSPDFVRRRVEGVDPEKRVAGFGKNYIWYDQDLIVIGDKPIPYRELSYAEYANGYLASCRPENGKVYFDGWAFFGPDWEPGECIQVRSGSRTLPVEQANLTLASSVVAEYYRDPRLSQCGFSGRFDPAGLLPGQPFWIEVSRGPKTHRMYYKFSNK